MINLQVLHGLRVAGRHHLKQVTFTPEGQTLGHIDGWNTFIDPAYCTPSADTVCNRALREEEIPINSGRIVIGNFEQGPLSFVTDSDDLDGNFVRINTDADVNPDAWTLFMVMEPLPNNSAIQRLVSPTNTISSNDDNVGVVAFNIGMNRDLRSLVIYENASVAPEQPQRLRYAVPTEKRGTRALVECTFSVRQGLKVFWNGELVAENPDDRRPLNYGYKAGEWEMFRTMRGQIGWAGVLDVDLSEPDHEGDRLTLEKFMMEKYGITS
ncbi:MULTISPECIES: hypothetical protein [unclassified Halomonas]|uniref:hypothetical protein n=1 Tax=unclassified Halomonas TaxID=2609666 RepID=UPI000990788F|nr:MULTISPECIES: hypothetical protein [unclassified Halomonas]AQU84922.1 hypothetical protein B2G49_21440 [Halomonas sp. 'Soap Lake \